MASRSLNRSDGTAWTLQEDEMLRDMRERRGMLWSAIAAAMPGRTERACQQRYLHQLRGRRNEPVQYAWSQVQRTWIPVTAHTALSDFAVRSDPRQAATVAGPSRSPYPNTTARAEPTSAQPASSSVTRGGQGPMPSEGSTYDMLRLLSGVGRATYGMSSQQLEELADRIDAMPPGEAEEYKSRLARYRSA